MLFSSVTIGENTRGRVRNISRNGLALETETGVSDTEFLSLSFQFSTILDWVKIRGRVAWRNKARNVIGIEFVGLSDDARKQIENWIASKGEFSEASRLNAPVALADHPVAREIGSEIAAESTTPPLTDPVAVNTNPPPILPTVQYPADANAAVTPSELVDLGAENRSQPATPPEFPTEPDDARPIAAIANAIRNAGHARKAVKLVGLALVAALLLSVVFLRGLRLRESTNIQKNKELTRAVQPAALPSQPVQPVPSGERPAAPRSQPVASAPNPAVPAPNSKDTLQEPSYVLQVASMIHEENANTLADSLRQMNFPAFVLKMSTERFHHVFVGPYDSVDAATRVKNDLEKRGFQVIRRQWRVKTR